MNKNPVVLRSIVSSYLGQRNIVTLDNAIYIITCLVMRKIAGNLTASDKLLYKKLQDEGFIY